VLVAGDTGVPEMTAEIYDAARDTWALTAPMTRDRLGHTATRPADGRVLVVGGEIPPVRDGLVPFEGTAEIFDLRTNTWSATGSLATKRGGFSATSCRRAKCWWSAATATPTIHSRAPSFMIPCPVHGSRREPADGALWHTAASLPDGNVLVVGGGYDDWLQMQVTEAELYDWKSGTWMAAGTITGRGSHSATLLDDGRVLVAGGYTSGFRPDGWRLFWTLDTADIFAPATRQWKDAETSTPRYGHLAAPLRGGGALIVQGTESFNQPPNVTYGAVATALAFRSPEWADLGVPAIDPAATSVTRLNDGSLLFVGQNHAVLYRY
jgi:hypothetical protein